MCLRTAVSGTTRKHFRAASNPSALGGRGDELGTGRARRFHGNWLEDGEEPLSAADFAARMSLTDITIYEGGTFEFWFNDCDLFGDHSICVSGDLQNGPRQCDIEG